MVAEPVHERARAPQHPRVLRGARRGHGRRVRGPDDDGRRRPRHHHRRRPAWHRHKIATRLLQALARQAIARGATSLTLEVRVGNNAAQALYRQFGFRPCGIRKNYYVETNEDALVMWADDVDSDEYAERLVGIEADIPGSTVIEETRQW